MKSKKNEKDIKDTSKLEEIDESKEIEEELGDTLPKEIIKKKIEEHNFFYKHFFRRLKEDKLYLISFIITIIFFGSLCTIQVNKSDGLLYKKKAAEETEETTTDTTLTPADEVEEEKIDVSDYVGTYSKEYILDNVITFGENCSVDSYKYIYQISSDGTITKYFQNTCIGTIKIWSDEFKYNNLNGARYIGTTNMNFTFTTNKIKEVDGDTYKIDTEINSINESMNLEDTDISFYGSSAVIMTDTNLIVINGDKASSPITDKYNSVTSSLTKRFYKSSTEYQYNFIVFSSEFNENCTDTEETDLVYTIYSIRFDTSSNNFLEPKTLVTRTKSDSCKNYKKDLATLKE